MNKKTLIIIGIFIIIAIAGFFISYENPDWFSAKKDNSIILFFSKNCPHCLKVEVFLQENKVAEKLPFENKGLDDNQANVNELMKKASVCGLTKNIGIPFLWDGQNSKCLMGDEDVINFFSAKVGSASGGKDKIASSTISG